jgi:hypothetical protein
VYEDEAREENQIPRHHHALVPFSFLTFQQLRFNNCWKGRPQERDVDKEIMFPTAGLIKDRNLARHTTLYSRSSPGAQSFFLSAVPGRTRLKRGRRYPRHSKVKNLARITFHGFTASRRKRNTNNGWLKRNP